MLRVITAGLLLLAGAALGALGARAWWPQTVINGGPDDTKSPEPPSAAAAHIDPTPREIAALGRLEPRGGVLAIGGITGDRLRSHSVQPGDLVAAGAELAILESYGLRTAELQLAQVQLAEAQAQEKTELAYADRLIAEAEVAKELVEAGVLEIEAQQARVVLAEANLAVATNDLARLEGLSIELVSAQERDHQRLVESQAQADLASSRALLARLINTLDLNRRQAAMRLATAQAARERVAGALQLATAAENVALATARRDASIIRAPWDGQVLSLETRPGEAIGSRPVVLLGNTAEMLAVAEVYEDNIRWIQQGLRATITSEALPAPLSGVVERVGTLVAGNQVAGLNPTDRADIRVVEVVVRLDPESVPLAAALVRLQVDVKIEVGVGTPGGP